MIATYHEGAGELPPIGVTADAPAAVPGGFHPWFPGHVGVIGRSGRAAEVVTDLRCTRYASRERGCQVAAPAGTTHGGAR